jgi:hypothetical protein
MLDVGHWAIFRRRKDVETQQTDNKSDNDACFHVFIFLCGRLSTQRFNTSTSSFSFSAFARLEI